MKNCNCILKLTIIKIIKSKSTKINKSYKNFIIIFKSIKEIFKIGKISLDLLMLELENYKINSSSLILKRIRYLLPIEINITKLKTSKISMYHSKMT